MRIALLLILMVSSMAGAQNPPPQPAGDPSGQGAALLPEFQSDLAQAGAWNRYTIVATISPQRQLLEGKLTLNYTNRDSVALDRVYFRLLPNLADFAGRLDISTLTIDGRPARIVYEQRRYLLRVDLSRRLEPGQSVQLGLNFRTTTPANAGRRYYGAFNLQNSVLALASAYPIVAIVRAGRWDIATPDTRGDLVNSETALYDVTLTAPADWTLATTGVAADGRLDAGMQTARFVSGPQRDFMIVAMKLRAVTGSVGGTRVNAFYMPGDEAGGQVALRAAVSALQVFSDRFGAYPLAELDIVPVDAGTFLGVEYPGITLIERRLYRGNPRELEIIVAHEVAHQWWYSLVGNNVQTEAWLDEALASYAQVVYAEALYGRAAAESQLDGFRSSYRAVRAGGRDAVVAQPNRKIRNYFPIVYAKGALFFEALRQQIGDEAFERFLKDYYANHRYGIATAADVMGSAEAACSCELDQLYRDWILTTAPVVIP